MNSLAVVGSVNTRVFLPLQAKHVLCPFRNGTRHGRAEAAPVRCAGKSLRPGVNRLWPAIERGGGARVVSVSSNGHQLTDVHWDDPHFESGYDKWQAYGQAKTANALFALHLDELGRDAGVRAFSVHPGAIATQLGRHMSEAELEQLMEMIGGDSTDGGLKTPEQGAATQVWAATSPQLEGMGGVYCEDCDIAGPAAEDTYLGSGVKAWATDPVRAARLWELSAGLTGVDAFARRT